MGLPCVVVLEIGGRVGEVVGGEYITLEEDWYDLSKYICVLFVLY
jgi:hypothetical protein